MRLAASLRGWASAAHPFPLAAVVALTALIAFASTGSAPDAGRLALLLLAMFCSQLAIGWSNDYLDRAVDADHQPWKPIPNGLVKPALVPPAIGAALALSLAGGAALGTAPLALLGAGTAAGLVYNLWLKGTRFSPLPFLLAFAVLPPFVWTALDAYRDEFLGLYAVAAPLALAAHLANVLPDVETDGAQGRRTLAVVLGRGVTRLLLAACLVAPPALLAATLGRFDYDEARLLGGLLIVWVVLFYSALCLLAIACYALASGREADVWGFRLVALASVVFASGWLASV